MAYKNKTYVCFDADNDIKYYNLMKAWKENETIHQAINIDRGVIQMEAILKFQNRDLKYPHLVR